MGLDTTHNCWHGSYGSFTRWRDELATLAGYTVRDPTAEEREDGVYWKVIDLPWDRFAEKNYLGDWDSPPGDDPLIYLLAHSDCDGHIHPHEGRHLADRLEQLLAKMPSLTAHGCDDWMQEKTRQFIDGLRAAVAANEDVLFH